MCGWTTNFQECFQAGHLQFAGDSQWLEHINGTRTEIPIVKTNEGTWPKGSDWARVPFPECAAKPCTDAPQQCMKGHGMGDICTDLAYPEPIPNTHGFGHNNSTKVEDGFHDYSIVDKVIIPADLEEGEYLLSWRW